MVSPMGEGETRGDDDLIMRKYAKESVTVNRECTNVVFTFKLSRFSTQNATACC